MGIILNGAGAVSKTSPKLFFSFHQQSFWIEAEKAKERQAESARRNQPQAQKVENFPPSEGIGKSRDIAAEKVGLSGRTAEKAAKVVTQVDNLKAEGKEHQAKELLDKHNTLAQ